MIVVDATILLAWAVDTPQSSAATALLADDSALAAPQAALTEALEGARKLAALGHMAEEDAAALAHVLPPLLAHITTDAPLMPRAFALATRHDLPLSAALALALAAQQRAPLATLDARLAAAAREQGLQPALET